MKRAKKTTKDPLIVQIERGATEINLRPILVPVVQAILTRGKRSAYDAVRPEEAEEWLDDAFAEASWWARARTLQLEWIEKYLRDNNWKRHSEWDKEKLRFEKRKKNADPRDSFWDQSHHVDLRSDHSESDKFRAMIDIVTTIMKADEFGSPAEAIDAIIENAGPLDRLANEGE